MVQDVVIGQELGKLQGHIQKLTAEIKEKQVQLKGLVDDVAMARAQATRTIQEMKQTTDTQLKEFQQLVAPLQAQVSTLQQQRQEQEQARTQRVQAHQEESALLKRERLAILSDIEKQITAASVRLTQVQQAIDACKQKVTTL